jgi:hypothetical protein
MSANNIEVQLKKLGMKNDVVGLEAFVCVSTLFLVILHMLSTFFDGWRISFLAEYILPFI